MQEQLYAMDNDFLVLLFIVISAAIVVPIAIANPSGENIKKWQVLLVLGVGVMVSIPVLYVIGLIMLLVVVYVTTGGRY